MDKKLQEKLRKKNWKKKEIEHAVKILKKRKKNIHIIFLDKIVYWTALLVAIVGNMLIAISLIPFLLALDVLPLYIILVIMALSFGFFFEIVIRDIENLEKKHHIIISVLIPSIALISFFIITVVANNIKRIFGIGTVLHEPLIVATTYSIVFMIPYAIYQLILRR